MKTVFVLIMAMAAVLITGCEGGEPDPGLADEMLITPGTTVTATVEQTVTTTTETTTQTQKTARTITLATKSNAATTMTTTTVTTTESSKLSEKEKRDMDEAEFAILLLQGNVDFMKMPLEIQKEKMQEKLEEIATVGTENAPYPLIVRLSIAFDEAEQQFTFMYTCGETGQVKLLTSG